MAMGQSRSPVPGPVQKSMSSSVSLPDIHRPKLQTSPSKGIYGRQWTTENRRLLHEMRERSWLKQQGKHGMIDFSERERKELRAYFEAIAEVEPASPKKQGRIRVDRLEDMLISLGLAGSRREVGEIVRAIDDKGSGDLDFEQYLTIVRTIAGPAIFTVFKAMIDGKLGDANLNFRTVISSYRRRMIMDATGVRCPSKSAPVAIPAEPEQDKTRKPQEDVWGRKKRGKRILDNFANLQKVRYDKGEKRGDRGETGEDSMPWAGSGFVPTGGMQMLWHSVCQENKLVPSRPASADKRALEPPRSPRDIIQSIVTVKLKNVSRRGTLVITAPDTAGAPDTAFEVTSRPTTQEGHREIRMQLPPCG